MLPLALLGFSILGLPAYGQTTTSQDETSVQGTSAPKSLQELTAGKRPADAISLFDGEEDHLMVGMSGRPIDWKVDAGSLVSTAGNKRSNHLVSKLHFRDALIHVEFMLPKNSVGNSGIYLHGLYELQILNSADKKVMTDSDAGAVYGFSPPLVNACLQSERWQVYDIEYRAPVRDEKGAFVEPGSITAELNGQIVQDHLEITEPRSRYNPYRYGTTRYLETIAAQQLKTMTGPLFLQDHDSPVRFRNVWVLPLDDQSFLYEPPTP